MTKAKRRINKFKFDTEDAHVALVDKAANAQEVLVMKAEQKPSEEELEKNSQPSVASQGEDVVKTEGTETDKTEEETIKMTDQTVEKTIAQDDVQEMIQKALEAEREEIRKSVAAEYEEASKQTTAELEILKAKEEAREERAFIEKATGFKEHLNVEEDKQVDAVQGLAKALRKMEADEECKPALDLLKSLKDTVEKSDLLEEVGGTSTVEKASDYNTEGDKLVMKMVKEDGMTEANAYAKALLERPELFQ